MPYTPLPIGIDDYEKIILGGYYYVDKTWFIKELIDKKGEANLFTCPRRFGKTLNQSMLKYYFEKPMGGKSNKHLFEGKNIMNAGERYTSMQEQYPVISLTLKSAKQASYKDAFGRMKEVIAAEYHRHKYVLENIELGADRERFEKIMSRTADEGEYLTSLAFLSECLYRSHKQKVIILIDEYDVPLENAYYAGFYEKMIAFIRSLFESALKTNLYLEFAVITGCLRISKESIFTGLNNLEVISILNTDYGEYFGFVEEEVKDMLSYYDRDRNMGIMKEWYDGYCFGNTEVYNPWSVINYTKNIISNEDAFPTAAWSNTSSNNIVKDLIYHATTEMREEIEQLINGEIIEKMVHEDITYGDIHESEDNLWNFLFFTGYLKNVSKRFDGEAVYLSMKIPNMEIRSIYRNTIRTWFDQSLKKVDFFRLSQAIEQGDSQVFGDFATEQLGETISVFDFAENYYHGFLIGLLKAMGNYKVESNRESGTGRPDIVMREFRFRGKSAIIEVKIAKTFADMEKKCDEALNQIVEKDYDQILLNDGYQPPKKFGVCFFKKGCIVKVL